jgi:HEAT repeat protein
MYLMVLSALFTLLHSTCLSLGGPQDARAPIEIASADSTRTSKGPCSLVPTTESVVPTGPDLTIWQFWWGFNREPYLRLRDRFQRQGSEERSFTCGNERREFHACTTTVAREWIAPALLRALRDNSAQDIVTGSLIALAKVDHAPEQRVRVAEEIQRWLSSEEQEIQESAAIALGILDDERSIPLLTALLLGDRSRLGTFGVRAAAPVSERTRTFAAFALGLIGSRASPAARHDIVAALAYAYHSIPSTLATRDIPVACLTSIGLTPLSVAADADLDAGFGQPERISDRADQLRWLFELFHSRETPQLDRAQIPAACARLSSGQPGAALLRRQVAQRLVAELDRSPTPDWIVHQSCALALGQLGDCDADPVDVEIRRALSALVRQREDPQSKYFAMIALGQVAGLPGQGAGDPLLGLDGEDNPRTLLLHELRRGRGQESEWAALAVALLERSLEDTGQPSSLESKAALCRALAESKAPAEMGARALAAALARAVDAQDVLRDRLARITEPEARGFTAIALGLLRDRPAAPSIVELVRRSKYQPELLKAAATGMALLNDGEIVPELVSMLSSATGLSSQAAISAALGAIGDVRAVEPLIGMLEDSSKTARARAFAAVALGMVADKDELPWNSRISIGANYRATTPTLTDPEYGTGVLDLL